MLGWTWKCQPKSRGVLQKGCTKKECVPSCPEGKGRIMFGKPHKNDIFIRVYFPTIQ